MPQLNSEYDFEHAPCGYLSFYPDGTITQINQTALKWLGCGREEVVFKKKLEAITPKGTGLYFQMFVYPLLKMHGYVNELSVDILSGSGKAVSCLLNASVVKNDDGSIRHIHAVLFHIAARKKYEKELLHAKKTAEAVVAHKERMLQAQRRIVSILGHDTRAPLFSINRLIKLAANGQMSLDEISLYFDLMANQLDATLILIDDLLKWSNVYFADEQEPEKLLPLRGVVDDVFDLLSNNAAAKALFLSNETDPDITVTASRSIVTFIIRNLVNNAIKFTGKGGVTVWAAASESAVNIIVSDTGIGMGPDQLSKFMAGELSSNPGTDNEQGSGMGLTLIKEFLLQLQGSIQAESTPGAGTRITVTLPSSVSTTIHPAATAEAAQV